MELIKQALVTSLRQDHLRNYNHYISITRVPMATKLGKMITYLDRLLLIKSHDPLISWSCKITLQNKTTISPLSERLWLPNLAGWYRSYLDGPVPIKSRHPLITWSCEITWQTKIFISITVPTPNFASYLDMLLPIMSHDPLITWSSEIIWETKTTISPPSECLWSPNLAR